MLINVILQQLEWQTIRLQKWQTTDKLQARTTTINLLLPSSSSSIFLTLKLAHTQTFSSPKLCPSMIYSIKAVNMLSRSLRAKKFPLSSCVITPWPPSASAWLNPYTESVDSLFCTCTLTPSLDSFSLLVFLLLKSFQPTDPYGLICWPYPLTLLSKGWIDMLLWSLQYVWTFHEVLGASFTNNFDSRSKNCCTCRIPQA